MQHGFALGSHKWPRWCRPHRASGVPWPLYLDPYWSYRLALGPPDFKVALRPPGFHETRSPTRRPWAVTVSVHSAGAVIAPISRLDHNVKKPTIDVGGKSASDYRLLLPLEPTLALRAARHASEIQGDPTKHLVAAGYMALAALWMSAGGLCVLGAIGCLIAGVSSASTVLYALGGTFLLIGIARFAQARMSMRDFGPASYGPRATRRPQ
jgi:hypothetical protein